MSMAMVKLTLTSSWPYARAVTFKIRGALMQQTEALKHRTERSIQRIAL